MKKITFFLSIVLIFTAIFFSYSKLIAENNNGTIADCEGKWCGEDARGDLTCYHNGVTGEYCSCCSVVID